MVGCAVAVVGGGLEEAAGLPAAFLFSFIRLCISEISSSENLPFRNSFRYSGEIAASFSLCMSATAFFISSSRIFSSNKLIIINTQSY